MNIKQIKERYTCLDYLGVPIKRTRNGFLYRCPWRTDRHPSLSVTPNGVGWHDLASGEHGDVIELVKKCLNTTDIKRVIAEFDGLNPSSFSPDKNLWKGKEEEQEAFADFSVVPLQSRGLYAYLAGRKIDTTIAKQFLQEAHYSFYERDNGRFLYALAYPNDLGGYELRSARFKGSTSPKGITTHLDKENAPTVVFEGFADMLSFATLCGGVKHNYVVLNSIVNAQAAIEVLKDHPRKVYLCLDNDDAGEKTTGQMVDALPEAIDIRSRFSPYKDVNEYLISRNQTIMNEKQIKEKWSELLQYAKEHATGEGFHRGYRWLQEAFNEYLAMSDEVPGYGMGGQPGSMHNRQVLAERICLELGGHVGGLHLIDENQEVKLKATLDEIVNDQSQHRGIRL